MGLKPLPPERYWLSDETMNGHVKSGPLSKNFSPTDRIETQIHRRRKVKVFSPLQIEWDGFHPSGTELSEADQHIECNPMPDA